MSPETKPSTTARGENTSETFQDEMFREQLEYVFRESRTGLFSTLILSSLALLALCFHGIRSDALIWYIYMISGLVVRYMIVLGYEKAKAKHEDLRKWESWMCFGVALSGAGWGLLGWYFFVDGDILGVTVVVFSTAGMSAGAIAALAVLKKVYISFLLPTVLPLIARCLVVGEAQFLFMGMMASVYIVFLLRMSKLYRENFHQSLVLRHENRSLVETLTVEKDRAEAASEAKTNFLATMSHEIRTPLNGVLGMLQVLKSTKVDQQQHDYLHAAEISASSLLELLDDILDISRVEAGKLTIRSTPFSLSNVIVSVSDVFRPRAFGKGLTLDVRMDKRLATVQVGDETRVRQVVSNLLSNAIKFTEEGGITVNVIVEEDTEEAQRVKIEINDTGIGISEEDQGRLFEAFMQIDSSMSRRYGGAGLGLAICQRLVGIMGGNLYLKSSLGEGSHFSFVLEFPKTDEFYENELQCPSLEEETVSTMSKFANFNVLVVEDESVNQRVAKLMFAQLGLEPLIVDTGLKALVAVKNQRFDLVFMDLQLPEMDGIEVTEELRKLYPKEELPVIALTANAKPEDRERCTQAGMNDFLAKPYRKEALKGCLNQWLLRKEKQD